MRIRPYKLIIFMLGLLTASCNRLPFSGTSKTSSEGIPQAEPAPLPDAVDVTPDEPTPDDSAAKNQLPSPDPLATIPRIQDPSTNTILTPLKNLRPDAAFTQMLPILSPIDPRGLVPTGQYRKEEAALSSEVMQGTIVVPSDGRGIAHPACARAMTAPGHRQANDMVIDGNLDDWKPEDVIAIDRAGDGANGLGGLDIRELYSVQSSGAYYFAVRLEDRWDSSKSDGRLIFRLRSLKPSHSTTEVPDIDMSSTMTFELIGDSLYNTTNGGMVLVSKQGDNSSIFDLAIKGNVVEVKMPRSPFDNILGAGNYAVMDITTGVSGSSTQFDGAGPYIIGMQDDYACLVPMPDGTGVFDHFKMFVMRREPTVSGGTAEVIYRAMIAAAPTVEYVAADHYKRYDTINVSVVKDMGAAGLYVTYAGIFFEDEIYNVFQEKTQPLKAFFVAAHEYAHGLNTGDYNLPDLWMCEGHSDWIGHKALSAYYGRSVAMQEVFLDAMSFLDEEDHIAGAQTIVDNNTWGMSPNSGLYYYRKSSTYYELLSDRISYPDWHDYVLALYPQTFNFIQNTVDYLTRFKGVASYLGNAGDELGAGWVTTGTYNMSVLPRSRLADADHDGLLDFMEDRLGTSTSLQDSDGDHYSDSFEMMVGRDPKVVEAGTYLAPDNLLSDWEAVTPASLHSLAGSPVGADCAVHADISRYGVVFGDHWLLSGIQLNSQVAPDDLLRVVIMIKEPPPGNKIRQILVAGGQSFFVGRESNNTIIRPGTLSSPFTGNVLEVPFNDVWLGWNGFLTGTQVKIQTYYNANLCDDTGYFNPTLLY